MIRRIDPSSALARTLYPQRGVAPSETVAADTANAVAAGQPSSKTGSRSRALVPLSQPKAHPATRSSSVRQERARTDASLVAHLLATEHGDPQTRVKRQVAPDQSALRYAEALLRPADPALRRSTVSTYY